MRSILVSVVAASAVAVFAVPCAAQGAFGIGARFTMVREDVATESSSQRFTGGQLRAMMSKRTGLELSLDLRTQESLDLTERVRDMPVQASFLLFPVRSAISPYVLGGVGWYSHRLELMAADAVVSSVTTRRFGTHAGFGGELSLGRHAGIHADYRYTFLGYGDKDVDVDTKASGGPTVLGIPVPGSRFLPNYEGSMWTAGLTIYF